MAIWVQRHDAFYNLNKFYKVYVAESTYADGPPKWYVRAKTSPASSHVSILDGPFDSKENALLALEEILDI